jgi:hypothetical protein
MSSGNELFEEIANGLMSSTVMIACVSDEVGKVKVFSVRRADIGLVRCIKKLRKRTELCCKRAEDPLCNTGCWRRDAMAENKGWTYDR